MLFEMSQNDYSFDIIRLGKQLSLTMLGKGGQEADRTAKNFALHVVFSLSFSLFTSILSTRLTSGCDAIAIPLGTKHVDAARREEKTASNLFRRWMASLL